jgi:putative FmdB family regulatory protein
MPVYEYRCNACSREFEIQQRMSDPDLLKCEACGKDALERLISRTAFQLKGSGWYKDLYSSSKPEKAGGDSGTSDKPAADKPAAKADAPASSGSSSESSSSSSSGGTSSGSGSSGGSSSGGGSTTKSAAGTS